MSTQSISEVCMIFRNHAFVKNQPRLGRYVPESSLLLNRFSKCSSILSQVLRVEGVIGAVEVQCMLWELIIIIRIIVIHCNDLSKSKRFWGDPLTWEPPSRQYWQWMNSFGNHPMHLPDIS